MGYYKRLRDLREDHDYTQRYVAKAIPHRKVGAILPEVI